MNNRKKPSSKVFKANGVKARKINASSCNEQLRPFGDLLADCFRIEPPY